MHGGEALNTRSKELHQSTKENRNIARDRQDQRTEESLA